MWSAIRIDETKTLPSPTVDHEMSAVPGQEPAAARLGGRFVPLYRVGRGGMGEVYAAYDPELARKVAVKVLPAGSTSEAGRRHLRQEGRALAQLNHPNVVKVYDVVSSGEDLSIAMEFVDGQTLADWLAGGSRSWRDVLSIFIAAGSGLAAAHAVGLIHRDFKPSNVMLTRSGEVRVLDFGVAQHDSQKAERVELTKLADRAELEGPTSACVGTPAYLAPECLAAKPADARSDQFSFCVALYEAICHRHPFFEAAGPAGSLEGQLRGRVKDLRPAHGLPGWLARALWRGLRPSPAERFPSMEALLEALTQGRQRQHRVWLGATAALLVLGGGAAGYLLSRSGSDKVRRP